MTRITFILRPRGGGKPNWTLPEDAKVARLRKSGQSAREIAEQIENRTHSAVESRLGALRKQGVV